MEDSPMNMSVILQFAKFSRGFQVSDFKEFIEEIRVENVDFLGRLAYPNQWQIRLTNQEVREDLIRTGKRRINKRSCWVYPLNQQEIRGFIYWLPNSVTNDKLTEYLKFYGEVLFVESEKQTVNSQEIESDRRYYGLILPHGTVKEDLPHFLKINGFLCLVIVRGRQPACFHCKEVGHRRLECSKYKAKVIGYCFRDPNTASPRLKPRGKRHIQRGTKTDTGINDIASSGDTIPLERRYHIDETIEPLLLSASDDRDLIVEDTSSVSEDLAERGALVEHGVNPCLHSSDVSFSKKETLSILETLQQIQRKTFEDLQQRLKGFENEISGTLRRSIPSTHTSKQNRSTVTETLGSINLEVQASNEKPEKTSTTKEDYDVDTCGKEAEGDRIPLAVSKMHHDIIKTIEKIYKNPREIKNVETNESTAVDLVSVSDMRSALQTFENTKEAAVEILEGEFKKLTEFAKSKETIEALSKDSAAEMHSHLLMLEKAKQTATEYYEKTFKNLEEEINNLSSQFNDDRIDRDTRLTKDNIQFAYQMLEHAKETVERTLQNTFKKLETKIGKVTESDEMTADISSESNLPLKISVDSRDSVEIRELLKDVVDVVNYFSEEKIAIVVEAESSEKQSSAEHSQESTLPLKIREDSRESTEILEETVEILEESGSSEKQSSAEDSHERILPVKIREDSRESTEILEEKVEIAAEAKQSRAELSQEETLQTDSTTASSDIFKTTKISSHSAESGKVSASESEKTITESKRLELQVSKTAQKNIDKLQTNIREIFASVLAKDESELLPETRTILKQVESKVNQVTEEMKNRLKCYLEDTFASFKTDSFK